VIVGGESGPRARRFNINWARNVIRQCKDAGTACFVKQIGAKLTPAANPARDWSTTMAVLMKDWKVSPTPTAATWKEWPEDLRIRQFPKVGA